MSVIDRSIDRLSPSHFHPWQSSSFMKPMWIIESYRSVAYRSRKENDNSFKILIHNRWMHSVAYVALPNDVDLHEVVLLG